VLHATVFRADQTVELEDNADISDELARDGTLVWVDVLEPTEDDLACIQEEFALHPLSIEDIRHSGQRPKLETFDDHAFLVAYGHNDDPSDLPEVEMFVGRNWLITVRTRCLSGLAFETSEVRARFGRSRNGNTGVGFLLYVVLDEMVDGYFDTVDVLEDQLEEIEQGLFEGDHLLTEQEIERRLLTSRKNLIKLRRRLVPMRDVVLAIIRDEVEWVEESSQVYFQDVLDHLMRVIDQIDAQREMLGSVVDAHLGLQANRMNAVMKKMTSWGAILIVATLIAGIYGMNFKNMPELSWTFGYPGALASMVLVTGGLFFWFKHKTWL
jgi:magnesium transporter